MPNLQVLACPTCGATLAVEGEDVEVKCQFCGNSVIIPRELRRQSAIPSAMAPRSPAPTQPVSRRFPSRLLIFGSGLTFSLVSTGLAVLCLGCYFFAMLGQSPSYRRMTPTPTPAYTDIVLSLHNSEFVEGGSGIAVDGEGYLYVAVANTGWIYQYNAQGDYLGGWQAEGDTPLRGITADTAGNIYVVRQGAILKYDGATKKLITKIEGPDFFEDVALLPDGGFLAFSNANGDDLVRLNAQGEVVGRVHNAISGQTGNPELSVRVAVDEEGNLYALGTHSSFAVFKFTPQGQFVSQFGGQGDEPNQFHSPKAIAADSHGHLYVSDTAGIKVFDSNGQYLRLLELPNFNTPAALFLSSRAELFTISDAYTITLDVYKFALR